MGFCIEFTVLPVLRQQLDHQGLESRREELQWISFPDELREHLIPILINFGYSEEDLPDCEEFLLSLEDNFRKTPEGVPWAILFFDREYQLGGHLLSIRPNRDLRFNSYRNYGQGLCAPSASSVPHLSIVYVYDKSSLQRAAITGSLLLAESWKILRDKDERENWAVVCDPLDAGWVRDKELGDDDLFFELSAH